MSKEGLTTDGRDVYLAVEMSPLAPYWLAESKGYCEEPRHHAGRQEDASEALESVTVPCYRLMSGCAVEM